MFKVHQGKYSSVNKLQDNFAFLALVMLLNPGTDTESDLEAQTPKHLGPVSLETRACHSQSGFFL